MDQHKNNSFFFTESENAGDGTYKFAWETSDGSKHEESGYLKPGGNKIINLIKK